MGPSALEATAGSAFEEPRLRLHGRRSVAYPRQRFLMTRSGAALEFRWLRRGGSRGLGVTGGGPVRSLDVPRLPTRRGLGVSGWMRVFLSLFAAAAAAAGKIGGIAGTRGAAAAAAAAATLFAAITTADDTVAAGRPAALGGSEEIKISQAFESKGGGEGTALLVGGAGATAAVTRLRGASAPSAVVEPFGMDVHHPVLLVLRAERCLVATGNTKVWTRTCSATVVGARLVADINHAVFLVCRAELKLLATGNTIHRVLGATGVGARLVVDINHAIFLVCRAELKLFLLPATPYTGRLVQPGWPHLLLLTSTIPSCLC